MRSSLSLAVFACVLMAGAPGAAQTPQVKPQTQQPKPTGPAVKLPNAPVTTTPICQAGDQDCDNDGARALRFGGNDCDDFDPRRAPAKAEIADANGVDEDCNYETFGARDLDGDGEFDMTAFNTDASGKRFGGTDCDDQRKAVRSTAQELPNKVDDDCNGIVDDLLGDWFTPPRR